MTTESLAETPLVARQSAREWIGTSIVATVVAAAIVLVCLPVLDRSIWLDEAQLFRNYPIQDLSALFSPLPYYNQAATPLYSLFASLLSDDIRAARSVSLFVIVFALAWLLVYGRSGWMAGVLAFLSILAFLNPLLMYSEFKHYGLEAVGLLIAVVWFMDKDPGERLGPRDIGVLTVGMLLGISTLITSTVALVVFVCCRYLYAKELGRKEMIAIMVFLVLAIAYYLLVKRVTEFQVETYSDSYGSQGAIGNARRLLRAGSDMVGRHGMVAVAPAMALLLLAIRDRRAQRLLLIAIAIVGAFIVAAIPTLYPAGQPRHLTWSGGLLSALAFFGVYLALVKGGYLRVAACLVCLGLLFVVGRNAFRLAHEDFEHTANNDAIQFIRQLPPSAIGFWSGQGVIHYYQRLYPDLAKHSYFGGVNPSSSSIELARKLPVDSDERFAQTRNEPGAVGRMVSFRMARDYRMPARVLIADAPRGRDFYVFATHYQIAAQEGYPKARVDALHAALSGAGCRYEVVEQLNRVSIYKANCPQ